MHPVLKIILAIAGIAIVATVVVGAVEILGSSDGPSAAEREAQVEHSIKTGLEQRAAQAGEKATVQHVGCVQSDSSHWECVARTEIAGEVASVPVSVISGDKRFIWKVGELRETPTAGSSGNRLPPAESLAWVQVTCGEVNRAAAERDYRWLARAGEAVVVQAVTNRPNADAEQLAASGARDLIVICRQASNPRYQPYGAANIALLTGRRP